MHRPFDAGVCLQCLLWAGCVANSWVVQVNFEKVTGVSNTTTTLQVVTNPILDRTFTAEDGSTFPNPIHDTAWQSLANLGADLVRCDLKRIALRTGPPFPHAACLVRHFAVSSCTPVFQVCAMVPLP